MLCPKAGIFMAQWENLQPESIVSSALSFKNASPVLKASLHPQQQEEDKSPVRVPKPSSRYPCWDSSRVPTALSQQSHP